MVSACFRKVPVRAYLEFNTLKNVVKGTVQRREPSRKRDESIITLDPP
jgi:hypothetical protein